MKDIIIWILIFIIGVIIGYDIDLYKRRKQEVPRWYIEKVLDWTPPYEVGTKK